MLTKLFTTNFKRLWLVAGFIAFLGGCATVSEKLLWNERDAFADFSKLDPLKQQEIFDRLTYKLQKGDEYTRGKALYLIEKTGSGAERFLPEIVKMFQYKKFRSKTNAAHALAKIGAAAIPALVGALENDDPAVRANAAWALGEIGTDSGGTLPGLTKALTDKDNVVRYYAAEALGRIRGPSVPGLINALGDKDPKVCQSVVRALVSIGDPTVPELLKILKGEASTGRTNAALALAMIEPSFKDTIPAIESAMADLSDEGKIAAVVPLIKAGINTERYLPFIVQGLADRKMLFYRLKEALSKSGRASIPILRALTINRDPNIRVDAVSALGTLGPAGKAAESLIADGLKDDDPRVRATAAKALGEKGGEAKNYIPALVEALKDSDYFVKKSAAEALSKIGPSAVPALFQAARNESKVSQASTAGKTYQPWQEISKAEVIAKMGAPAVPELIEGLKDKDWPIKIMSFGALGKMGSSAKAAVPELIIKLKDGKETEKARAAAVLAAIGPGAVIAIPVLIESLQRTEPNLKENAAEALGKIGLAARAAIPELRKSLGDRPWVRVNSALALWEIAGSTEGVPVLIAGLQGDDSWIKELSLRKLVEIGPPAAASAVPDIRKLLSDKDYRLKKYALEGLGTMGEEGKAALPELIEIVKSTHTDTEFYETAVRILGSLGPAAKDAIPALAERLNAIYGNYQSPAGDALGRIGAPAVPALVDALKNGNINTRETATKALGYIGPAASDAIPSLIGITKSRDSMFFQKALKDALLRIDPPGDEGRVTQAVN